MTIPIAGWVAPFGYPRINACSRLPMAFRSVPRPSSPPGAKASTECPSYAQEASPCTETILRIRCQASGVRCQTTGPSSPAHPPAAVCAQILLLSTQQHPPGPRRTRPVPSRTAAPGTARQMSHASERLAPAAGRPRKFPPNRPVRHTTKARPETHQNLIHPDKDHAPGGHPPEDHAGKCQTARDVFAPPRPALPIAFALRRSTAFRDQ